MVHITGLGKSNPKDFIHIYMVPATVDCEAIFTVTERITKKEADDLKREYGGLTIRHDGIVRY
jgi:hypothetical protein